MRPHPRRMTPGGPSALPAARGGCAPGPMKRVIDSPTGLEVLDHDECLRLLAADEVGRLALVDGGAPVVFPVNYGLDGEAIVFRTAPGTKLAVGPRGPVAFEVDAFDRTTRTGWSIVATG